MERRGFTLIELLVVIAIIAILAAILFPVFAKAREKARQTACLSNLRQIATAALMYAEDYEGRLPACWCGTTTDKWGGGPGRVWWNGLIMPYMKDYKLQCCPSFGNPRFYGELEPYPTPTDSVYRFHAGYGMSWYNNQDTDRGWWIRITMGEVHRPSSTIYVLETGQVVGGPRVGRTDCWPYDQWVNGVLASPTSFAWGQTRHNDGMNIAFVDGHAKWSLVSSLNESMFNPTTR